MSSIENYKELVKSAIEASKNSYSPFSNFKVGAALLTKSQKVYLGCNIENSAYPLTNCAERTAFFKAISEGEKEFEAIAIVGSKNEKFNEFCPPCGACRQVINEFCDSNFKIICGRYNSKNEIEIKEYTLKELLPEGFKLAPPGTLLFGAKMHH